MIVTANPASAADTAPPQLVDWSTTSAINISDSYGQVTAKFILSDDSKIDLPQLKLKSLTTTQITTFATVKVLQQIGKLTSYEATVFVQKEQAPRDWHWVLSPLSDSLGNRSVEMGPGGSWNARVAVYNKEFTESLAACEKLIIGWNNLITTFEAAEKNFPGFPDFGIFRLKHSDPIKKRELSFCSNPNEIANLEGRRNEIQIFSDQMAAMFAVLHDVAGRAADKAVADKAAALEAADKAADKVAAKKKTTITCINGKLTKKVTAVNPKCPAGFKKK